MQISSVSDCLSAGSGVGLMDSDPELSKFPKMEKKRNFMFEDLSVGLETSPGTCTGMSFVGGLRIYKQRF
jgi:hypothetical protein